MNSQNFIPHFKKLDWPIIITASLLAIFGLVSIYSSSLGRGDFLNFKKQIIFFVLGFVLMLILSFLDWRILRNDPFLVLGLYFLCVLVLLGLLFFAPEIRGTKSWYQFGLVSFDPIEFAKVIFIILFAKYFSLRHVEMYRIRHILVSGFYVLGLTVLVLLQPDLGSTIILILIWIGIMIISGIKIRHLLFLGLILLLIFIISWNYFLKDYQKDRILGFINPQLDPTGISWSQTQAKIAIGSGGIFGQGIGKGFQTQYGFLPEAHTDFIFASIAEETGIFGIIILLGLFSYLIWRIIKIALFSQTNFVRIFCTGLAILLISQIFINIGMNLGLLPIIGLPLPLISYGGSSLIAIFLGLGILQSTKTH